MGKHKQRRHKGRTPQPPPRQPPAKTVLPTIRIVAGVFLGLATLCGCGIAILQALPRLSLNPDAAMNPLDPYMSTFKLSNDGYLSDYSIKTECRILCTEDVNRNSITSGLANTVQTASSLDPDKSLVVGCNYPGPGRAFQFSSSIAKAIILVRIKFRPAYIFWTKTKSWEFTAAKDSTGSWHWIPIESP